MDVGTVTQIISQVGFPIAISLILLWQNKQETDKHQQEMSAVTEALNNNTLALNRLLAKMGADENE